MLTRLSIISHVMAVLADLVRCGCVVDDVLIDKSTAINLKSGHHQSKLHKKYDPRARFSKATSFNASFLPCHKSSRNARTKKNCKRGKRKQKRNNEST